MSIYARSGRLGLAVERDTSLQALGVEALQRLLAGK